LSTGVEYKDPDNFGEWHLSYRSGDILSPRMPNHEPLSLQVGSFVSSIVSGETPEPGLSLAMEVVRLAEAAEFSVDNGGAQVLLGDEVARLVA
jgi:predicted dehydrogenase